MPNQLDRNRNIGSFCEILPGDSDYNSDDNNNSEGKKPSKSRSINLRLHRLIRMLYNQQHGPSADLQLTPKDFKRLKEPFQTLVRDVCRLMVDNMVVKNEVWDDIPDEDQAYYCLVMEDVAFKRNFPLKGFLHLCRDSWAARGYLNLAFKARLQAKKRKLSPKKAARSSRNTEETTSYLNFNAHTLFIHHINSLITVFHHLRNQPRPGAQ